MAWRMGRERKKIVPRQADATDLGNLEFFCFWIQFGSADTTGFGGLTMPALRHLAHAWGYNTGVLVLATRSTII